LIFRSSPDKLAKSLVKRNVEIDAVLGGTLAHKGTCVVDSQRQIKELDMLLAKRANLHPTDHDRPDQDTLTQQWRGEYCPNAETSGKARSEVILWFLLSGHECEWFADQSQLGQEYRARGRLGVVVLDPHSATRAGVRN
jgi:hypothetical protein